MFLRSKQQFGSEELHASMVQRLVKQWNELTSVKGTFGYLQNVFFPGSALDRDDFPIPVGFYYDSMENRSVKGYTEWLEDNKK